MSKRAGSSLLRIPVVAAAGSLVLLFALVLQVAGRPLATNDLWWHLAMGQTYASEGPWLADDPLVHTARAEPPHPAAWLFGLGVYGVESNFGYQGLRGLHAALVVAIVAMAFALFRRESDSLVATCLASAVFLVLAWPRLLQMRPDLVSILLTLLLYKLVLEPEEPPSWKRGLAAVALFVLWANSHAVFMLGPCLVVAGLLGLGIRAMLLRISCPDEALTTLPKDLALARRVAAILGLGLLAALANPRGVHQHLAFLTSAGEGAIFGVLDDWTPFHPFVWDRYGFAVGYVEWLVADVVLVLFVVAACAGFARFLRRSSPQTLAGVDPVLFGLGLAALVAAGTAVRFLWLAVFPLLFLLRAHRVAVAERPAAAVPLAWVFAAACVALALALPASPGFARTSASLPRPFRVYLERSFASQKYHEAGVRFLEETGVEGKLFNSYAMGGYLGYRLAPKLLSFVDGRMNVDHEVIRDYANVNAQRGSLLDETFLDVLDRREIDVFFGVEFGYGLGVDQIQSTIGHLKDAPGWRLIARGPRFAIYLRANLANQENLERVVAYYERRGAKAEGQGAANEQQSAELPAE